MSFARARRLLVVGRSNLDTIVVLEHGRMVEQGTGAQLLQRQGVYARLYQSGNYPK